MSLPLLFLVRFLAVAGLLFGCWPWISPLYIGGILPMANALFAAAALPVQLELHETVLVFAYEHSAGSMLRHVGRLLRIFGKNATGFRVFGFEI